jgi:hypothetical protein
MLARKRPAVGSIRTLELDGKTYTKLNEGGRHDDVGRGVRLSLRRWLLPVCLLVRTYGSSVSYYFATYRA